MSEWVKRNVLALCVLALLVLLVLSWIFTGASHQRQLDEQQAAITHTSEDLKNAQHQQHAVDTSVVEKSRGIDTDRVEKDTVIIDDLLGRAMTWKNHDEYERARREIMAKYHISEKSSFMTSFLPPDPITTDGEGRQYSYIDSSKLNSTVGDTQIEATEAHGPLYSYAVLATVQTTSQDSKSTTSRTSPVFLKIDGTGKVTDLQGYASSSQVRISN